jgi:hypothetical protein
MKFLDPIIRKVRRRKQWNRDPNSPWENARSRWVTYLLVRLGKHQFNSRATENTNLELTETPTFFDAQELPPMPQEN